MSSGDSSEHVLILGGNGLLGTEVVVQLLEIPRLQLTLVNRGSQRWDFSQRVPAQRVRSILCDRRHRDSLHQLKAATADVGGHWHWIIDFSAFLDSDAASLLDTLGPAAVGHYIYISSDSVYEVSERSSAAASREQDARRPAAAAERGRLAALDAYGDGKLAVEELLQGRCELAYTALRLPDVLGTRDTTRRWWSHQLWLQYLPQMGRAVPVQRSSAAVRTSFVYAPDVGRAVQLVMKRAGDARVRRQAFNVSSGVDLTAVELLQQLARRLNVVDVSRVCQLLDDLQQPRFLSSVLYRLPSVTRGPVDISKAVDVLGFQPTPWQQVLNDLVTFYQRAFSDFPEERDVVVENLLHVVEDEEHRRLLKAAVEADILKCTQTV